MLEIFALYFSIKAYSAYKAKTENPPEPARDPLMEIFYFVAFCISLFVAVYLVWIVPSR